MTQTSTPDNKERIRELETHLAVKENEITNFKQTLDQKDEWIKLLERGITEVEKQRNYSEEMFKESQHQCRRLEQENRTMRGELQNAQLVIQLQQEEFQGELQMLARRTAAGAVAALPVAVPVVVPAAVLVVAPVVNELVPVQEGTDFAQGTYGLDSLDE